MAFKVTWYEAKAPVSSEKEFEFIFDAVERESEYCSLCECFNGHSLSCVKIRRDYIEPDKEQ